MKLTLWKEFVLGEKANSTQKKLCRGLKAVSCFWGGPSTIHSVQKLLSKLKGYCETSKLCRIFALFWGIVKRISRAFWEVKWDPFEMTLIHSAFHLTDGTRNLLKTSAAWSAFQRPKIETFIYLTSTSTGTLRGIKCSACQTIAKTGINLTEQFIH